MYKFFAMLSRMKYIERWGLMRNTRQENLCEHSFETAIIAHALATIKNEKLNGKINAERAAVLALFHDCTEIITGDLPTPIKYDNIVIQKAYKNIEKKAGTSLLSLLPQEMRKNYEPLLLQNSENDADLFSIVKCADRISALIKCTEECNSNNHEFFMAKQEILKSIHNMQLPEAELFLHEYFPAYSLSLDEMKNKN